MASLIYLDTHVVAWLYAYGANGVSERATLALERSDDIRLSPMVRLELQYLYEIGRTSQGPAEVIDALSPPLGLRICTASFGAGVQRAEDQGWTRDPFDRLIVAQASLFNATLVTKDDTLHQHYSAALW